MTEDGTMDQQSWASSESVRRSMRANRGRDTAPEVAVRKIVHSVGLRYRVDHRPIASLNRRADLVFTRARVAVFIDGCFWHGCPEHHTVARTNAAYWSEKVQRNRVRDAETNRILALAGWQVLRFWEHEPPSDVAAAIIETVRPDSDRARGGSSSQGRQGR
jgi:DNA mismatch endonuclease (patch repair protein)